MKKRNEGATPNLATIGKSATTLPKTLMVIELRSHWEKPKQAKYKGKRLIGTAKGSNEIESLLSGVWK